ncbi:Ca(2+)-dependent cysteine protease, partial [Cladochytrium tenue]
MSWWFRRNAGGSSSPAYSPTSPATVGSPSSLPLSSPQSSSAHSPLRHGGRPDSPSRPRTLRVEIVFLGYPATPSIHYPPVATQAATPASSFSGRKNASSTSEAHLQQQQQQQAHARRVVAPLALQHTAADQGLTLLDFVRRAARDFLPHDSVLKAALALDSAAYASALKPPAIYSCPPDFALLAPLAPAASLLRDGDAILVVPAAAAASGATSPLPQQQQQQQQRRSRAASAGSPSVSGRPAALLPAPLAIGARSQQQTHARSRSHTAVADSTGYYGNADPGRGGGHHNQLASDSDVDTAGVRGMFSHTSGYDADATAAASAKSGRQNRFQRRAHSEDRRSRRHAEDPARDPLSASPQSPQAHQRAAADLMNAASPTRRPHSVDPAASRPADIGPSASRGYVAAAHDTLHQQHYAAATSPSGVSPVTALPLVLPRIPAASSPSLPLQHHHHHNQQQQQQQQQQPELNAVYLHHPQQHQMATPASVPGATTFIGVPQTPYALYSPSPPPTPHQVYAAAYPPQQLHYYHPYPPPSPYPYYPATVAAPAPQLAPGTPTGYPATALQVAQPLASPGTGHGYYAPPQVVDNAHHAGQQQQQQYQQQYQQQQRQQQQQQHSGSQARRGSARGSLESITRPQPHPGQTKPQQQQPYPEQPQAHGGQIFGGNQHRLSRTPSPQRPLANDPPRSGGGGGGEGGSAHPVSAHAPRPPGFGSITSDKDTFANTVSHGKQPPHSGSGARHDDSRRAGRGSDENMFEAEAGVHSKGGKPALQQYGGGAGGHGGHPPAHGAEQAGTFRPPYQGGGSTGGSGGGAPKSGRRNEEDEDFFGGGNKQQPHPAPVSMKDKDRWGGQDGGEGYGNGGGGHLPVPRKDPQAGGGASFHGDSPAHGKAQVPGKGRDDRGRRGNDDNDDNDHNFSAGGGGAGSSHAGPSRPAQSGKPAAPGDHFSGGKPNKGFTKPAGGRSDDDDDDFFGGGHGASSAGAHGKAPAHSSGGKANDRVKSPTGGRAENDGFGGSGAGGNAGPVAGHAKASPNQGGFSGGGAKDRAKNAGGHHSDADDDDGDGYFGGGSGHIRPSPAHGKAPGGPTGGKSSMNTKSSSGRGEDEDFSGGANAAQGKVARVDSHPSPGAKSKDNSKPVAGHAEDDFGYKHDGPSNSHTKASPTSPHVGGVKGKGHDAHESGRNGGGDFFDGGGNHGGGQPSAGTKGKSSSRPPNGHEDDDDYGLFGGAAGSGGGHGKPQAHGSVPSGGKGKGPAKQWDGSNEDEEYFAGQKGASSHGDAAGERRAAGGGSTGGGRKGAGDSFSRPGHDDHEGGRVDGTKFQSNGKGGDWGGGGGGKGKDGDTGRPWNGQKAESSPSGAQMKSPARDDPFDGDFGHSGGQGKAHQTSQQDQKQRNQAGGKDTDNHSASAYPNKQGGSKGDGKYNDADRHDDGDGRRRAGDRADGGRDEQRGKLQDSRRGEASNGAERRDGPGDAKNRLGDDHYFGGGGVRPGDSHGVPGQSGKNYGKGDDSSERFGKDTKRHDGDDDRQRPKTGGRQEEARERPGANGSKGGGGEKKPSSPQKGAADERRGGGGGDGRRGPHDDDFDEADGFHRSNSAAAKGGGEKKGLQASGSGGGHGATQKNGGSGPAKKEQAPNGDRKDAQRRTAAAAYASNDDGDGSGFFGSPAPAAAGNHAGGGGVKAKAGARSGGGNAYSSRDLAAAGHGRRRHGGYDDEDVEFDDDGASSRSDSRDSVHPPSHQPPQRKTQGVRPAPAVAAHNRRASWSDQASEAGRSDDDYDDHDARRRGGRNGGGGGGGVATVAAGHGPSHGRPQRRAPRRRALLIGINYTGQKVALQGCVNDVRAVRRTVLPRLGFSAPAATGDSDDDDNDGRDGAEVRMLLDDRGRETPARRRPTRANILEAFAWLRDGVQPGDLLYFHYSGHGSQAPSSDSYESLDETLVPVDYLKAGQIIDNVPHDLFLTFAELGSDDLNEYLVHGLPTGVRLTAVFDCCHSGTILDLPYQYNKDCHLRPVEFRGKRIAGGASPSSGHLKDRSSQADVVALSACTDAQVSTNAKLGAAAGVLKFGLLRVLEWLQAGRWLSYADLLRG